MISVRLSNPEIILAPITEEEKNNFESEFMGDESIYVLYRLPNHGGIHIGMMSSSMRKYFPGTANIWKLGEATAKAYFYNGGSNLAIKAREISDRPVYCIRPTDDRLVDEYEVINATPDNGLDIFLEDVVDGNYTLAGEEPNAAKELK